MRKFFLFAAASRPALGPTNPPIQWVPGALSQGIKWLGREADHTHPSSAEVKECVEICIHSPNTSSWRGVQLKHREVRVCLCSSLCPQKPLHIRSSRFSAESPEQAAVFLRISIVHTISAVFMVYNRFKRVPASTSVLSNSLLFRNLSAFNGRLRNVNESKIVIIK